MSILSDKGVNRSMGWKIKRKIKIFLRPYYNRPMYKEELAFFIKSAIKNLDLIVDSMNLLWRKYNEYSANNRSHNK